MELTVKPDNVCICRCMSSMGIKFFASKQFDFVFQRLPRALDELKELREFYDPDTVELMKWIK